MDTIEQKKPKQVRRSNAERSAKTRSAIIGCAIEALSELGYNGTTLNHVAERAGLSKGAMLHQFHSKDELMVEVAKHCVHQHTEMQSKMITHIEPKTDPLLMWFNNSRDIVESASYVALLEIMLAMRSEKNLAAEIQPLLKTMFAQLDLATQVLAANLGVNADDELKALVQVHINAFRGIAMEQMIKRDKTLLDTQMNALLHYSRKIARELIAKQKSSSVKNA